MSIATKANNKMLQVTWSKLTNWFASLIDIEFFCIEKFTTINQWEWDGEADKQKEKKSEIKTRYVRMNERMKKELFSPKKLNNDILSIEFFLFYANILWHAFLREKKKLIRNQQDICRRVNKLYKFAYYCDLLVCVCVLVSFGVLLFIYLFICNSNTRGRIHLNDFNIGLNWTKWATWAHRMCANKGNQCVPK